MNRWLDGTIISLALITILVLLVMSK